MTLDISKNNDSLETNVATINDRKRDIIFSPLRLMYTLLLCIFIIETLVMVYLESTEPVGWKETIIDSSILTTTLFFILYFTLFKPLVGLIADYKHKEIQLKNNQDHLEQKVDERTDELNKAYLDLKAENAISLKIREDLRESEDRFRQLFVQNEDAIVLLSSKNKSIIDVNPTSERIFRKQRTDLLAGGLSELCDPENCELLATALDQIDKNNSTGLIERFKYIQPNGEVLYLSFHGKKISLQGVGVIYTTFRDITARVRMEEQAQETQARLIQANRMASLGTIVSSVAHEINNPNNFLLMNAEIIKRIWNDLEPVIAEHFQDEGDFAVGQTMWSDVRTFLPDAFEGLQQGALRICNIVGHLKEYSRDAHFNRESVADVNSVVQLSVSILSHHISSLTHKFRLEKVEGLPLVKGSALQLEQVVINIIQNALQALPDAEHGVLVNTGVDPENGDVLIRVIDEGIGIPPEIAARVMEPFFTTRLEKGGTGLGLAISSSIVKEHGGRIEFCSRPGQGTTFTIRLRSAESSE
ncbi:MAG: PAS domain S-box protein [Desulfuromonadales bacterium]|nr:PAS domain S-box protein [Desulfuromonadales bacterium]